jgi:ATP-dependent exoDNAse (exonuclease V) alpha subunit
MYHLQISAITRSKGRSVCAAAAYQSRSKIVDERTGLTHDYSKKSGVIDSFLIGWNGSRQELWNAAEAAERRKDATTARAIVIALPHEATDEQRRIVVATFARCLRRVLGVAVDCAIHAPSRGDARNHHAHLIFTARAVDDFGNFAAKKYRELEGPVGKKNVETIRATWSFIVQKIASNPEQWDHRSYAARGIDREPTKHRGPYHRGAQPRHEPQPEPQIEPQIDAQAAEDELVEDDGGLSM